MTTTRRTPRVTKRHTTPPPGHVRITMAHDSLQFSDTRDQKLEDVADVFDRADALGAWWVTGTESGDQPLSGIVKREARRHGFRLHRNRGNWIAVRRDKITPGTYRTGVVFVAHRDEFEGRGRDRAFPWVKFTNVDVGTIAVAAGHYPTKGKRPGDPNHHINRRYAAKLGAWARRHGKGKALAFYQGDQNMPDDKVDTFLGQPLTTCWDELGKYPGTGHGVIDVIASYDKDGRVSCSWARALNDRQFHQHSDHFHIEAGYDVRVLPRK